MKKIYTTILSIAILIGGFTSCSSDFLDPESTNVISNEEIVEGDPIKTANSFLNGAYKQLFDNYWRVAHDDFSLKAIHLATDMMCEDMTVYNGGYFFSYDYQNDNRALNYRRPTSTWRQLYYIIYSANNTLRILQDIEQTDEAIKCKAEALGLRGYAYFVLINMYQQPYSVNKEAPGVPIYDIDDNRAGRNTVAEVYDIILSDLLESYDILEGKGMSSPTALSEYSVAGMLARVLCFINDYPSQWTEVARYAEIASKGSPLMTTATQFSSGFDSYTLNETLWASEIDAETNTYYGSFFSQIDPYNAGYAGLLGYPMCIASWLYDKINPQDMRYTWFSDGSETYNLPKYASIKYTEKGRNDFTADYIYMRSSEFYYVRAEALYLSGDTPGARNALETVMSTRLAGYSAADKSGAALLEEIRIQKRIECWAEGVRLFDMKWRGEAMDRAGSTNHELAYISKLGPNPKEWIYMIPEVEMDANDEITENNP